MDEHLSNTNDSETFKHFEVSSTPEMRSRNIENQEEQEKRHSAESIDAIREKIDQQALSKESALFDKQAERSTPTVHYITKQIKTELYRSTLIRVQKHLSPAQQRFSKFVHRPIIETVSEIGAKSVARPSGLLGGSLMALLGSLTILIIARQVGFVVPNSIFGILFVIGFCLGIIIEFAFCRPIRSRKNKKS